MKISATVIAKNEEEHIANCVSSLVNIADEIIVVDSGSTDDTQQIAKKLGAQVIFNEFQGHVQQKNFAMNQGQFDWVLSLDADEELSPEAIVSVQKLKTSEGSADAFAFNRLNNYCGTWLRHGGWYPDRKIRLWNRSKGKWGGMNPHDQIILSEGASVKTLNGDILHYTYDKVSDHIRQMRYFSTVIAESYFAKGKRTNAFEIIANPAFSFFRDYILKAGFLDGKSGLTANRISARYQYWKYKKLYDLQQAEKHDNSPN